MKDRLKLFGLTGLFWVCFFVVSRIIFLLYHYDQTSTLTAREISTILALGLRMDLAMAGYWMIITGLLLSIPLNTFTRVYYFQNIFTLVLLIISAMIVVVDLELYLHWGFRMNKTPLYYMSWAAAGSVNPGHLIVMIVIFIALLGTSCFIYYKFLAGRFLRLTPLPLKYTPLMILVTGLLFIPIRSSFSVAPLNTGAVYFHKTKSFPNHAGINVVWNFFNSLSAKDDFKYPSNLYSGNADSVLHELVKSNYPAPALLNTSRPNIILIILESFTSKIIEPLGGLNGITPNLNALIHEGILFDHFYASGDRTDKGLLAILSSYPAQPETSIIRFPQKTQSLSYFPRELEKAGYHTSFVYGGDIEFANMNSYLNTAGFGHITSDDDFEKNLNHSKWGVADDIVFKRLLNESDTARNPFFKVMLSLSSHEPFEVPMSPVIKENDERSLFLNACIYTDKSLGDFIQQAKQKQWWKNTLIVVTADHGHRFPNAQELKEKERFQIPLLWLGGTLRVRDTLIHTLGSQTDIAHTLLDQIGYPSPAFKFGKDILSPEVKPFAVYIFNNGFGYVSPGGEYIYDFDFKKYSRQGGTEEDHRHGRAYIQALFNDYNSR